MAQIKEEELPPSDKGRAPLALGVRCKSCLFFKHAATFKLPCSEMDVKSFARPCSRFTANHYAFDFLDGGHQQIAELMARLKDSRIADLTALFNQELRTRKQGYRHGQIVYVRMFSDDYLSNYARAKVVLATKEYIYLQGFTKKSRSFRGSYLRKSVLTEEQFERKRRRLIKAGKLRDPALAQYTAWKPPVKRGKDPLKDYVVPTIDVLTLGGKSAVKKLPSVAKRPVAKGGTTMVRTRG